jgi:hypothetical protein
MQVIQSFGLDKPVWEQYWLFLTRALSGDLGNSFVFNQPALTLILNRMPATLELAFVALFMALVIGIPLGVYAGLKSEGLHFQVDHDLLHPRLQPADLLDRSRHDHVLQRLVWAGCRHPAAAIPCPCSACRSASSRWTACPI